MAFLRGNTKYMAVFFGGWTGKNGVFLGSPDGSQMAVVVKTVWGPILVGRCTTHSGAYFSGDWDVHWGYDFDFDPWPYPSMRGAFPKAKRIPSRMGQPYGLAIQTWVLCTDSHPNGLRGFGLVSSGSS